MQHTLHIFVGEDLSSIAELVNRHLGQHCDSERKKFSHVATWTNKGYQITANCLDTSDGKTIITNEGQRLPFFDNLHPTIVTAEPTEIVESFLYVCIYFLLYDNNALEEIKGIIHSINQTERYYIVDVFGIGEDLANLFCKTQEERNDLIYHSTEMKEQAKKTCKELIEFEQDNQLRHFLLIQGCNLTGHGLELNQESLIRIFGEYARLVTTNYLDIYPTTSIDQPDIMALGISAFWYNPDAFKQYIYKRSLIESFKKQLNHSTIEKPEDILNKEKELIDRHSSILDIDEYFEERLQNALQEFHNVLDDDSLSLPQRRALIALLTGKVTLLSDKDDDDLLNDDIRKQILPTIDDCLAQSLRLFIEENNKIADSSILTVPQKGGKVYLPLEELKQLTVDIRRSKIRIKHLDQNISEIKKEIDYEVDAQKRLTENGFIFGGNTYKLIHNVVEKPLEETFTPQPLKCLSIDLRNGFSRIRNQKGLGACTSFSMASIFEYILNQGSVSKTTSLSPRFLYYNVCDKGDSGPIDNGGSFYKNIKILGEKGICSEDLCPYTGDFNTAPSEDAYKNASERLVTKAMNVDISHEALTSALEQGYPVGISLKIFDSFGKGHKGFIFRPSEKEINKNDGGHHAMVICGYSEKEKVYIVRNSWGENFGDNGYCYIPFSYIEDKDLCSQACIVTGVNCKEMTKHVVEEVHLNLNDKDTKYSILRIQKEEEEQLLRKYLDSYKARMEDYIKLLGELKDKDKREFLAKHAISAFTETHIKDNTIQKDEGIKQKDKKKILGYTFEGALITIAAFFAIAGELVPAMVMFAVGVILFIALYLTEEKKEQHSDNSPNPPIINPKKKELEKKFKNAGKIIDEFTSLHDDLSLIHDKLVSFISHLDKWKKEEQSSLVIPDGNLRKPFYSLYDLQTVDNYVDNIIGHMSFPYPPKELKDVLTIPFEEFQIAYKGYVNGLLTYQYAGFSMYDYINGTSYPFLKNAEPSELFRTITNMSVPFAQTTAGLPSCTARKIMLCNVPSDSQEQWEEIINEEYTSQPVLAKDTSKYKLTFIQIQKYDLNETLYG